jgi:hypothetical protein
MRLFFSVSLGLPACFVLALLTASAQAQAPDLFQSAPGPAPVARPKPHPQPPAAEPTTVAPQAMPAPVNQLPQKPAEAAPSQQLRGQALGVWYGRYLCGQGESGVEVSLTEISSDGVIHGTFQFFNMPGMHNTQPGKYSVVGVFDVSGNTLRVDPVGWIDQPGGYVMVGFTGSLNASGTHLGGNINNISCGQIYLDKMTK